MYRLLETTDQLRRALPVLQARPSIAVDLETTGKDPVLDKVYLIGLDEFIVWTHPVPEWAELLRGLFMSDKPKLAHHWSFDGMFLQAAGIRPNRTVCTMVGAQLLKVGLPTERGTFSLGNLVEACLGVQLDKDGHGRTFIGRDLSQPPSVRDLEYLAGDTSQLKPLAEWVGKRIKAAGLERVWKIENTYTQVLAMMTLHGTPFDADQYRPVLVQAEADFKRLEAEVSEALTPAIMEVRQRKYDQLRVARDNWNAHYEQVKAVTEERADNPVNTFTNKKERRTWINASQALWKAEHPAPPNPKFDPSPIKVTSHQQLKAALAELGLEVEDTKRDTLLRLKATAPVGLQPTLDTLAEFSRIDKLLSAYGWDMIDRIHPDGRLRSNYQQVIATGRTSSSKWSDDHRGVERGWNSQNAHPDAKACVKAPHGRALIVADYAQIELRVATELILRRNPKATDALVLAYRDGKDPHSLTTAQFLDIDYETLHARYLDGDPEATRQRKGGKTTNFSWVFGISAIPLAIRIYADRKDTRPFGKEHVREAESFLHSVRETNPTLVLILKEFEEKALKSGFVSTLVGRRRHFPILRKGSAEWWASQGSVRRAAANMPIQGTAADICKDAANRIYGGLELVDFASTEGQDPASFSFIFNAVHDEICVETDCWCRGGLHEEDNAMCVASLHADFVRSEMERAFEHVIRHVPCEVAVGVSTRWKH